MALKLVIGDSILSRTNDDNLISWPKLLFNDVEIICYYGMTSNNFVSNGIPEEFEARYQYLNDKIPNKYDFIIIHLGICDCWPRFFDIDIQNNNLGEKTKYNQYVSPSDFENNIRIFINKFSKAKVILSSIIIPDNNLITLKDFNYSDIVTYEVKKYNNILKNISNNKTVFYIDLNNSIDKILFQRSIKFADIFNDINGHVAAREFIQNKEHRQTVINLYSEIWKDALSQIDGLNFRS